MLKAPQESVIVPKAPENSVIVLKAPKSSVIVLKAPKSSNTQVPQKTRKMEAPEQSDDVVKAPCPSSHPNDLQVKPGEDGPLPQVTLR